MSNVVRLRAGPEPLLTKQQLAVELGRSTRWIELRMRDDNMPSIPPSARDAHRRFRMSEVQAWLAKAELLRKPASTAQRLAALEQQVASLTEMLERRTG